MMKRIKEMLKWQKKAKGGDQENVACNARMGGQGNAQARATAKRMQQETPKWEDKRMWHGMPKPNSKVNATKKAKGDGQENVVWHTETGRRGNTVGNTEGKGKENTAVKGQR